MKHESPSKINLNKIIRENKPIVALLTIMELITYKIQSIFTIRNMAKAVLNLVTFE